MASLFHNKIILIPSKIPICRAAQIQCVHSHNRKIHFSKRTEVKIQCEKMQSKMDADNTQNLFYLLAQHDHHAFFKTYII